MSGYLESEIMGIFSRLGWKVQATSFGNLGKWEREGRAKHNQCYHVKVIPLMPSTEDINHEILTRSLNDLLETYQRCRQRKGFKVCFS